MRSQTVYLFFFNDTATTEIYTLSLHDALPISGSKPRYPVSVNRLRPTRLTAQSPTPPTRPTWRSEEHTSELQSRGHLVCRLLLEKKNITKSCSSRFKKKKRMQRSV